MRLFTPDGSTQATIRAGSSDDAEMLAVLGARLFVQAYGPTHPEPELTPYLERSFAPWRWAGALADTSVTVLVAEDRRGAPAGYAMLRESLPVPSGVVGARPLEIQRFYVDEAWHGRGVAQTLMAACMQEAERRESDVLWLSVWQESPRPQAFYARMGFRVVGTTTFLFGQRVDEDFVMQRPVPASTS